VFYGTKKLAALTSTGKDHSLPGRDYFYRRAVVNLHYPPYEDFIDRIRINVESTENRTTSVEKLAEIPTI